MVRLVSQIENPKVDYYAAYRRDAVRWAMLIYVRRERLSYEETVKLIWTKLDEKGPADEFGNLTNPAERNREGDLWISVRTLRDFLGPKKKGPDLLKGERLRVQQIDVMAQFIEIVLKPYATTFTPDGLSTQYGDFSSRLFYSPIVNNNLDVTLSLNGRLMSRLFLSVFDNTALVASFKQIPDTAYMQAFIAAINNFDSFFEIGTVINRAFEPNAPWPDLQLADMINQNKNIFGDKWRGIFIPEPLDRPYSTFDNIGLLQNYTFYFSSIQNRVLPGVMKFSVGRQMYFQLFIHDEQLVRMNLLDRDIERQNVKSGILFKELDEDTAELAIMFDKLFGYVK